MTPINAEIQVKNLDHLGLVAGIVDELGIVEPLYLTKKASRSAKKPTASRFEPDVRSCCQTTVCCESSCRHQNQLDLA